VVPLAVAVWAVLEIWLFVVVAGATNGFVVLLCILAGFVLGAAAVKRAGRSAWRNLTASVTAQQQGTRPAAPQGAGHNGLAMLGGMLLIIPGFVSDVVALVLLLPLTRGWIGRRVDRALVARGVPTDAYPAQGPDGTGGGAPRGSSPPSSDPSAGPSKVIQGEVVNRD
jgi:UPF0716 protein FxsA